MYKIFCCYLKAVRGPFKTLAALDAFNSGEKKFDYLEVMACPGGCVVGGGVAHPGKPVP